MFLSKRGNENFLNIFEENKNIFSVKYFLRQCTTETSILLMIL